MVERERIAWSKQTFLKTIYAALFLVWNRRTHVHMQFLHEHSSTQNDGLDVCLVLCGVCNLCNLNFFDSVTILFHLLLFCRAHVILVSLLRDFICFFFFQAKLLSNDVRDVVCRFEDSVIGFWYFHVFCRWFGGISRLLCRTRSHPRTA